MTYWFSAKPKLSSVTLKRPGLVDLLLGRTSLVSIFSAVFHAGMVVSLITGMVMEALYFSTFGGVLRGYGWTLTWVHGFFGLAVAVGFAGILVRFFSARSFRIAAGRMFYVDAVFIVAITVSGIVLLLEVLGVLPAAPGWWPLVHLTSVMAWLIVSLFGNGLVAHAWATVVYRFTAPRTPASFEVFSSACVGCGRCVEVCPLFEARQRPEEAPALKVRRYLKAFKKGASPQTLKAMAEDVYACTLCGLCVAVCPYSFRHYELYTALLAEANKATERKSAGS